MSLQSLPHAQPDTDQPTAPPARPAPRRPGRPPKEVEEDIHVGICPYYNRERGQGVVYCEAARLKFPDRDARREIVYRFCAHPDGYKACMLKQALDHFYERKYEHE